MDAILICGSNVLFENFAAFAVFGVVGFLRRWPTDGVRLGAFVVGFLTLPEAVVQMPGSNFWAFLLFFTLIVLGFSSAFVMLDCVATMIIDGGTKYSRPVVVTFLTLLSFLMCIPYCTQFGYYLLDGIDRWVNNVLLIAVVFLEVVSATTVYRWTDVAQVTGTLSFAIYNTAYFLAMLIGIVVAHTIDSPGIGAGVGIGIWILGSIVSTLLAKQTTEDQEGAAGIFRLNPWLSRFYYLAFYSVSRLEPVRRHWPDPGSNLFKAWLGLCGEMDQGALIVACSVAIFRPMLPIFSQRVGRHVVYSTNAPLQPSSPPC